MTTDLLQDLDREKEPTCREHKMLHNRSLELSEFRPRMAAQTNACPVLPSQA